MQLIRNQRGSLLIIVMVMAGIFSLLIPSLYVLQQDAVKHQAKRAEVEKYDLMMLALKNQIEDPNNCHKFFEPTLVFPTTSTGSVSGITLNWKYLYDPTTDLTKRLGTGWKIPYSDIIIDRVQLLRTSGSTPYLGTNQVKIGGVLRNLRMVSFRLYIRPRNYSVNLGLLQSGPNQEPENIRPMEHPEYSIRLLANLNAAGNIFNCFGHDSIAGICQAVGGVYNHLGPADLKCQPDTACFPGNPVIAFDPAECTSQGSVIHYTSTEIGENDAGQTFYMCSLCKGDLP